MASAQAFFDLSQGPNSSLQEETSSEDSDFDEQPQAKRKRGPALRYKLHKYFRTVGEYKNWWKAENEKAKWVYHSTRQNKSDLVETWFCTFVEKKGYACTSRLKLSFSDDNDSVTVELTADGHNHEPKSGAPKLNEQLKKRISELADQGIMPKRINFLLSQEGLAEELPEYKQVRDFVNNRRPTRNQEPFTDRQLASYCERNLPAPVSPDGAFVLAYEVESSEQFFVVWTTKKLLERQLSADHLQVDATNGLNWHNYPLYHYHNGSTGVYALFASYQRSFVSEPANWDEYCNRRYEVFKVSRSVLCGGSYYTCTCSEGTKKRVCKHAVLIMCNAAKVAQFPPAATATPLVNSRRKKPTDGRPALAAPQNRHAIA